MYPLCIYVSKSNHESSNGQKISSPKPKNARRSIKAATIINANLLHPTKGSEMIYRNIHHKVVKSLKLHDIENMLYILRLLLSFTSEITSNGMNHQLKFVDSVLKIRK